MRLSAISRSRPAHLDNPAPALYALAWIGVSRDHHQAEVDTMPTIPGSLRSTARRVPDAPALTFGGRTSTYAELDATVDQTACALAGLGLRPGDRFALMATNSDQFVVAFYAALRAGRSSCRSTRRPRRPRSPTCWKTPVRRRSRSTRPPPLWRSKGSTRSALRSPSRLAPPTDSPT